MKDEKIIYFKVKFNNFRDVSGSYANEVTDREEWETCECVLSLPSSYTDDGDETPLIISSSAAEEEEHPVSSRQSASAAAISRFNRISSFPVTF